MWTPHRIRIDQKLEMIITDVSQFWHDGCVHDLPGPGGRRCDRKRSGEDNQTIQRQQLGGSQSGSLTVSILNHPGRLVQLQYWLRLLILPGCRLHRHCIGHQLLLLLSKTHIWLCFYILSHRLSRYSGNEGLCHCWITQDYSLDCPELGPTIWSLSCCDSHHFPEVSQYCSLFHLLLKTLHIPLCLQVTSFFS